MEMDGTAGPGVAMVSSGAMTSEGVAASEAQARYLAEFAEEAGYLDFAKVGPISRAVLDARHDAESRLLTAGPTTVAELERARALALSRAAAIAGFPAERLVDSPSTSAGLFQVAFSLAPRGGRDQVLISAGEFPSNRYPWARAERAGGLEPVFLRPAGGRMSPEEIAASITDRTAAVAVSAVDFRTGYAADLRAIRESIGDRWLVVDGIQGFGAVPLDWAAADAVVVGGQKWLRSGWGTGFIALSERLAEAAEPLLSGWTSVADPGNHDGVIHPARTGAAAMAQTNLSSFDHAALAAGLGLVQGVGVGWIAGRIRSTVADLAGLLADRGATLLSDVTGPRGSGIVPFTLPGRDMTAVHERLLAGGVACTRHGDRIRLSAHATTTPAALALLEAALPSR